MIKPNYFLSIITLKKIRILLRKLFISNSENKIIEKKLPHLIELNKILFKAKSFASKKQAKLTFIYIPTWERYADINSNYPLTYRYSNRNNNDIVAIKNLVDSNDISWINIHKYLNGVDDPLDFFPDRKIGHFTDDGYEKISMFILEKLKSK